MRRNTLWVVAAVAVALAVESGVCRAEGNVFSAQIGDVVFIVGDGAENQISIVGDFDNNILILDGDLEDSWSLSNVSAILIDTGGGDDHVTVNGTFLGDVAISCGAGIDSVNLKSSILGDVSIEGGQDTDNIHIQSGSDISGSLQISTGQGVDIVRFSGSCTIDGDIDINTGSHADFVSFATSGYVAAGGDLTIDFGQGNDALILQGTSSSAPPVLVVGGSATLHGDQGFNDIVLSGRYVYYTIHELILATDGLEIDGFE